MTLAEISVTGGQGASCHSVVNVITSRWSDVKRAMLPLKATLKRPKRGFFYCVSPEFLRGSIEKRIGFGVELKCFTDPEGMGLGMCCDESLTACARLNPEAVPEAARPARKEKAYKPSPSEWVKPPSDKDQW
jgi:hypothetical protein